MSSNEQTFSDSVRKLWAQAVTRRISATEIDRENRRIQEAERHKTKYLSYFPEEGPFRRELYPKQMKFFEAGARFRERALIAGNRVGKSDCGAYETMVHLTGLYPEWWAGKRFSHPTQGWAAGNTNTTTRDILQAKLLGRLNKNVKGDDDLVTGLGTGMLPGAKILGTRPKAGIPDAVEIVYVKHVSGGTSVLNFKSYEQGREAFEGTEKHFVWLDEECPEDVYTECLMRTMTTAGVVFLTFTPLEGLTLVVMKFLPGGQMPPEGSATVEDIRFVVTASWDEVPHLTDDAKKALWQTIPVYQRDARSRGVPQLGSGQIYPVSESDIVVPPMAIPDAWRKCYGLDVGWNRTACVWLAEDPISKVWYAWNEHYQGRAEPALQAQAIRARGDKIPGVIDPAARGRTQVDGRQLLQDYRDLGLLVEPAKNTVEAGLYEVWEMMTSGMLKVFSTLKNLLEEYRTYRRDERGHVVKDKDHLMDALRYAVVSGREKARPSQSTRPAEQRQLGRRPMSEQDWMG